MIFGFLQADGSLGSAMEPSTLLSRQLGYGDHTRRRPAPLTQRDVPSISRTTSGVAPAGAAGP